MSRRGLRDSWARTRKARIAAGRREWRGVKDKRGTHGYWTPCGSLFMVFPEAITAMRVEHGQLFVDTAAKRYRVYERPGRKPRRRLIGLLKDLL